MARYLDISNEFRSLAEAIGPERVRNVTLADIPRCTVEGLAFEMVGDQERFEQFEFLDSVGIAHLLFKKEMGLIGKTGLVEHASAEQLQQKVQGEAELSGDAEYYLTTRELKDSILRIKRSECKLCRYEERCPGAWEVYVKHHGWSEFESVGALR